MLILLCLLAIVICGCDEQPVQKKAKPATAVLYAFQAEWCGPCHSMEPVLLSLENQGIKVRRIDVDKEPRLAAQYGVQSLPTFVAVRKNGEVGRVVGATTGASLKALVRRTKVLEKPRKRQFPRL